MPVKSHDKLQQTWIPVSLILFPAHLCVLECSLSAFEFVQQLPLSVWVL
jgi:hypothetical protein